jgi:hypothetical protein
VLQIGDGQSMPEQSIVQTGLSGQHAHQAKPTARGFRCQIEPTGKFDGTMNGPIDEHFQFAHYFGRGDLDAELGAIA